MHVLSKSLVAKWNYFIRILKSCSEVCHYLCTYILEKKEGFLLKNDWLKQLNPANTCN